MHGWRIPYLRQMVIFVAATALSAFAAKEPIGEPGATVRPAANDTVSETASVFFHGEEIFRVATVSEISAPVRAARVVATLTICAKSPMFRTDIIKVKDDDQLGVSFLVSQETLICSVWEQDAAAFGKPRKELAEEYAKNIRTAIDAYRKSYTRGSLIKGVVFAVISTALLVLILYLLKLLKQKEGELVHRIFTGKKFFKFLDGSGVIAINSLLMRLIWFFMILWLLVFYLNLVLSFFPWTFNLSATLFGWIITPIKTFSDALVRQLPNLFSLAVIVIITKYILRGMRRFFMQIGAGTLKISGFYTDWADPTYRLISLAVIALAVVAAFPYIPGSSSPAFKGISLFIGVLFSLGSTSVMSNLFAGIVLTYMRPFSVGDYVEINQIKGTLVARKAFATRIRTNKNQMVSIPNTSVAGNHIINYSRQADNECVLLYTAITIGYDAPWRTVHQLLLEAAAKTNDIMERPEPFVVQSALEDFYVRYELNVATRSPHRWTRIHSELHQNIQDCFAAAGVEIMSPHYRHNRTGNDSTIPKNPPAEPPVE